MYAGCGARSEESPDATAHPADACWTPLRIVVVGLVTVKRKAGLCGSPVCDKPNEPGPDR